MIAQFNGYEISPVHTGDTWKICDLVVANEDRFKRYFPETLKQNLNPILSQYFVESKVKAFKNKELFLFTLKHSKTRQLAGLIYIKELDWNIKQGEFAYCIDYNFENKGCQNFVIWTLKKSKCRACQNGVMRIWHKKCPKLSNLMINIMVKLTGCSGISF